MQTDETAVALSTKHFIPEKEIVTREIGGETIIVPIRDDATDLDSIYVLNELGAAIWHLLDGQTTIRQIVADLEGKYEVEYEDLRQDVVAFLRSLVSARLLRDSSEPTSELTT